MKSSQITLIVIGFILFALMATNPTLEDHRQAVIEKMKDKMAESSNSDSKNELQKAGEAIGMTIGQGLIDKAVIRDNYLFFSLTQINENYIGIGVASKVFIFFDSENNKIFSFSFTEIISLILIALSIFTLILYFIFV
jgi:hypothetical protein